MEPLNCPQLAVPKEVMHHVVRVESSFNPFAIGVVGGRLRRQPKSLPEALATVRMLESRGYNFSIGLAQVNRYNLGKYGIDSYERAFETCPNLQTGSRILAECRKRSGGDWGKAFSCYYSGDFVTGYRHGYVQKIQASMRDEVAATARKPGIEVMGRPSRRVVEVTHFPMFIPQRSQTATTALSVVSRDQDTGMDVTPALPAQMPEVTEKSGRGRATGIHEQLPVDEAFVF
jgi:type IV secretion system protein VirB1